MLSSDFLFPRFFVVPLANPSNFSHCKCFSSQIVVKFPCFPLTAVIVLDFFFANDFTFII